jgi:hypothetical protein
MREQPEILALLERFERAVANVTPVGLGGKRRGLAEQAVCVE